MSNYRVILFAVIAVTILCYSHTYAGPIRSFASVIAARSAQSKIPRSIRTPFRNTEMMTARGFGKRSQLKDDLDKSWNFHKQETAFADDALLNDAIDANGQINDSLPIEWFLREMAENPMFVRTILEHFVDTNHDGQISSNELSAPIANPTLNELY